MMDENTEKLKELCKSALKHNKKLNDEQRAYLEECMDKAGVTVDILNEIAKELGLKL